MGMAFIKYRSLINNKWAFVIAAMGVLLLLNVRIGSFYNLGPHLMAVVLYIFLMNAGEWIMKIRIAEACITELSRISYAVFLIQHLEILQILEVWNPETPLKIMAILAITIVLILVEAKMLTLVTDAVVRKGIELTKIVKISKMGCS